MTGDREVFLQLVLNNVRTKKNVPYAESMMYDVPLPYYNGSRMEHLEYLRINDRAGSHDHSIRSGMSSKHPGSEFMPQSIFDTESSIYQEEGDDSTEKYDFKVNERDVVLLQMSWDILLKEYLTPEELKVFHTLLYSNKNINSTERPYLNTNFEGLISKTSDPTVKSSKIKKRDNDDKVDTALFCSQFYDNLIAMDPLLEDYFPSLRHQAVSFCKVLNSAVDNLEDVHVLDSYIVKLGKRHSRILGIKTVGFEVMGMAFMTTLQDRFGSFFTLELKNLWGQLYSYMANCMIKAGKDPMEKTKSCAPGQDVSTVLKLPVAKLTTHDTSAINELHLVKTKNATRPNNITQVPKNKPNPEIVIETLPTAERKDRTGSSSISPKGSESTKPRVSSSSVVESSIKNSSYEKRIRVIQKTAQQKNCSIM
ncbi:hypothetical protein SEUBUCD646_0N00990 [Saccharomyces eubayanus]|uniref:Globin domain-containing protein n=2 Tax=Saccharomyces TaxID=4930 RepID=A0A6C1EE63_SACPS|nr:hypothetical protein GRS66_010242 [Saccharomyces pastorianus]CAI1670912.1 hypothetical protein SEUBUCD650_0N00990 [Saccharomyces eubayanus]CAI1701672.1 hypothetical protein SEUBUCD646_0N00990 [Saccharomyces eubayanus]